MLSICSDKLLYTGLPSLIKKIDVDAGQVYVRKFGPVPASSFAGD
jgi:hypothetical protein